MSFSVLAGKDSHRDAGISTEGMYTDDKKCCSHVICSSSVLRRD